MSFKQEQAFIQWLENFNFDSQDLTKQQQLLASRLVELKTFLQSTDFDTTGLQPQHPLFRHLQQYLSQSKQYIPAWEQAKQELRPALDLAENFADKIMFLVFGKFNAGKSSFCNFIAERFKFHQKPVQPFTLEDGKIHYHDQAFQEGTTETTVHIQGVILDERLVLIDTPGLHSITTENALLTQRFLESADGILWLSSSTSPGQVQELQELAQELRRGKPLLPVISRSDFLDEVVVDNDIKKILCNKTPDNRALQEKDVLQRAQEKLQSLGIDKTLIQQPISISVYSARGHGLNNQALAEAGFYNLYQGLLSLTEPVVAYKEYKPLQVFIHFLEEVVLRDINRLSTKLADLNTRLITEHKALRNSVNMIKNTVWQNTLSNLPALMDKYLSEEKTTRNQQFFTELNSVVQDSLGLETTKALSHYKLEIEQLLDNIDLNSNISLNVENYETFYLAIEKNLETLLHRTTEDLIELANSPLKRIREQINVLIEDLAQRKAQLLTLSS